MPARGLGKTRPSPAGKAMEICILAARIPGLLLMGELPTVRLTGRAMARQVLDIRAMQDSPGSLRGPQGRRLPMITAQNRLLTTACSAGRPNDRRAPFSRKANKKPGAFCTGSCFFYTIFATYGLRVKLLVLPLSGAGHIGKAKLRRAVSADDVIGDPHVV